jgi:MFS family permease
MQGLLMTAFSFAAVITALFGGNLIDRLGARVVVSVALVLSVVGNILGLVLAGDVPLLVSRVLEGAGYGVTMTGGPVIIAAWYEPRKRGLVSGIWGANVGIGILLSLGVANPILAATDWTGMWIFSLVATVFALALVAICVKMPPEGERQDLAERALDGAGDGSGDGAGNDAQKHGVLWGYAAPLALLAALMFFLVGGATDAFNSFSITYFNVLLERPFEEANMISMIASFGFLVGSIIVGFIFAHVKDKGLVVIINLILCAAILFVWFNLDLSTPVTYAIAFVAGCVLGAAPTLFFAIAPDVARSSSTVGAAVSLVVLGQNLGTLTGPTVVGMILDSTGYSTASMVMGIAAVLAVVVGIGFRVLLRKREREQSELSQEHVTIDGIG